MTIELLSTMKGSIRLSIMVILPDLENITCCRTMNHGNFRSASQKMQEVLLRTPHNPTKSQKCVPLYNSAEKDTAQHFA